MEQEKSLRRVICQVQEESDTFHAAIFLKVSSEEAARLQVDTHGAEHNGEVVVMVIMHALRGLPDQTGLSTDLCGNFVVGKTGGRKDGDLLTAGNRVHRVDGRDTGRDHFFGVHLGLSASPVTSKILPTYTRVWVDGAAVDVEVVLRQHLGTLVDGLS